MSKFSFGGVEVESGEIGKGRWKALELSDNSWVEFPVMVINGVEDGPVLYLGSLMHGDEYSGIGVLHGVIDALDPQTMCGTIVVVPVQNPVAHRARGRLTLIVQSDTTNMHRVWPGNVEGDANQRLAGLLYREIIDSGVTAALDFHSGTSGHECAAHTFVPAGDGTDENETADRAFELAKWFDLGVIMRASGGAYANTSWMEHALCVRGIPAFGVELGEGAKIQPDFVERGVHATLRLLRYLNIIEGEVSEPSQQQILVDEAWVRANRGGFMFTPHSSGLVAKKGMYLGHTVDVFGEVVEQFTAPADGYVLNLRKLPVITTGERVCRIGLAAS